MTADRVQAAAHRATITTVLTLSLEGYLDEDGPVAAGDALTALGIVAPEAYADRERRRFPTIYAVLDEQTITAAQRTNLERRIAASTAAAYAADLLELAHRVNTLRADPAAGFEEYVGHPLRGSSAAAGEDLVETYTDELDTLIGESYPATTQAAG